ncbi:MAG: phenylalanine--tRNA ligase subunit beta [Thermoproteus sp.]
MPVIDVSLWDLQRLVGASEAQILNALEYVKGEVEGREGDRLKIEITHDRPDHFSAEGLARTLKGILGIEEGLPEAEVEEGAIELRYEGIIEERPYAVMAVVRDLTLDDEAIVQMIQLQEKLHDTYGRDRRKIAIGYYDLSKIKPPIFYRRISQEDRYTPLGFDREIKVREMYEVTDKGRKYASLIKRETPPALVDSEGKIMVVVPVLGSECCKVTPSTRDILIDVTGPQLEPLLKILSILVYNLLERSKSRRVELVKINGVYPTRLESREVYVDRRQVGEMLGVDLSDEEYRTLLRRARHDVRGDSVLVAPYRINIISWVDIAEDIAIMKGYGNISRAPPPIITAGRRHRSEISSEDARRALLSLGFQEVMNGVLIHSALLDAFGLRYARVMNPVSERLDAVRSSLLPGLLSVVSGLKRSRVKLFEIGDVVAEGLTRRAVAAAIGGDGVTITDGISVFRSLCIALGVECRLENGHMYWCTEGRCAELKGEVDGYVGEVRPDILTKLGVFMPVVLGEIFLT